MSEVPLYLLGFWTYPFEQKYFTEMRSGSGAGSYLRLIDFCITHL